MHLHFSMRCFPEVPGDCKGILKEASRSGKLNKIFIEIF